MAKDEGIVWDSGPQDDDIVWDTPAKPAANTLGRQVGLTGRALANVATSPIQIGGNLLNKTLNKGNELLGGDPNYWGMPSDVIQRGLDKVTPKPANAVENITQEIAKSAPTFALPAAVGAQMAGNAAANYALSDRENEMSNTAIGAAAPAVFAAAKPVGKVLKHTLGMSTGAGGEAVEQAYKAGTKGDQVFQGNMRGAIAPEEVVMQAKQGVDTLRQGMYQRYANSKGGWAGDTTPLNFKSIADAVTAANNKYSFKGVAQPGVADVQRKVGAAVTDWAKRGADDPAFFTVEGLDALKRHLQDLTPDYSNPTGRAYVTGVVNEVRDTIISQKPQYAAAMKDYSASIDQLDEISKQLSLGDKASVDTALRKLTSLTRNNVNTNYGARLKSADALAGAGADIMPAVSGQALNSWTPRGLQTAAGVGATMVNPASLIAAPALSPRMVGEAAYYTGKLGSKIKPLTPRMAAILAAALRQREGK